MLYCIIAYIEEAKTNEGEERNNCPEHECRKLRNPEKWRIYGIRSYAIFETLKSPFLFTVVLDLAPPTKLHQVPIVVEEKQGLIPGKHKQNK